MNLRQRGMMLANGAIALALAGCVTPSPRPTLQGAEPPASMQWLYGSGEAAYIQKTVYSNMIDFVAASLASGQAQDVVIHHAKAVNLADAGADCGNRPPAVVFDIDETVILNLGYERYLSLSGQGYSPDSWKDWERTGMQKVAPVPGAVNALAKLAKLGVAPVFISDRSSENASGTIEALAFAGVTKPVHMRDMFLKGDISEQPGKDARRAHVSANFCVIALVGDQLGDFSDELVKRGRADVELANADPWGKGWFLLPNPVYGSGVRGDIDAVMPPAYDWHPRGK